MVPRLYGCGRDLPVLARVSRLIDCLLRELGPLQIIGEFGPARRYLAGEPGQSVQQMPKGRWRYFGVYADLAGAAFSFNFRTTSLRIKSFALPGYLISKSNRLSTKSAP